MGDKQSNQKIKLEKVKNKNNNKEKDFKNSYEENKDNHPTIYTVNKIDVSSNNNNDNNNIDVNNLLNLIEKQSKKYKSIKLLNNKKTNEEYLEKKLEEIKDNINNFSETKEIGIQTKKEENLKKIEKMKFNIFKEKYKKKLTSNNSQYKIKKLKEMIKEKNSFDYFKKYNLYEKKIKELKIYLSDKDLNYVSPVDGRRIDFNRKINKREIMKNRNNNKSNSIGIINNDLNRKYDKFFNFNSTGNLFSEISNNSNIQKLKFKERKNNFNHIYYKNELFDFEEQLSRTDIRKILFKKCKK
jgi:hypothetical protein